MDPNGNPIGPEEFNDADLPIVHRVILRLRQAAAAIDPLNELFHHADALIEWLDDMETCMTDGE